MNIFTSAKSFVAPFGLSCLILLSSSSVTRAQDMADKKPELSVQPQAPAVKEPAEVSAPAAVGAPVVKEPVQPNPPADANPLDSVAQGLSATPTALPTKAPVVKQMNETAKSGSGSVAQSHTGANSSIKPSSLKPMGPSIKNIQGEKLAQATGHFARARSLLIAALNEFDQGLELANPDALFSSSEWRSDVTARARDIEHILAPQARETTGGIKFQADPRLLGEAKR